jgi:hypothetical protein
MAKFLPFVDHFESLGFNRSEAVDALQKASGDTVVAYKLLLLKRQLE